MTSPVIFTWTDDGTMKPWDRFRALCDKQFVVGENYPLVIQEERSHASHRQYFASLAEAWNQLPEAAAERFQTVEHLRKYALIKAGYHDERSIVCASKAEAQRLAAFVRPMDTFAVVTVHEAVITVYTAKSQSMRAMGRADFQKSKEMVLEIAWGLCGMTPSQAAPHVGRAA